jgi:hypothetical protein
VTPVTTIKPHLRDLQCPEVLRALPGWLTWRLEHHDGEPKPRKVPWYTNGAKRHGVQGSPEDRQQLTSFDAAKAAAARRGMDGVGFCPMPEWGIVALDFDDCITAEGVHPDVQRLVTGTYAEFSPSGTGVRAFMRGSIGNRKDSPAKPFGFEVFSSKGFVTFTGQCLDITELTECQNILVDVTPEVLALYEQRFRRSPDTANLDTTPSSTPALGLTFTQLQDALDVLDPSMPHDPWLRVGMALHHETAGEGFELWNTWSAGGTQYPGGEALQARWDSFGKGGQTPTTVHALVRLANEAGAHINLAVLEAGGDFQVIAEDPKVEAASKEKSDRFKVIGATEFADRPLPTWVVRDVLPKAELVVLFGESTAGKSFVALDMVEAIARGLPWRGKRVKQGRVVYVVAEGGGGFSKRLRAYEIEHQVNHVGVPLGIIHAAPNLIERGDAVEVCKQIVTWGGADVVVVDTFAKTIVGGNENAGEDVGRALANCNGLHRATGAVVVLIHHAGKDASKGARGWSGLKAAADAEIEVLRMPAGQRLMRTSKQKDGEDGLAWGFDLKSVPVGMNEDGDVETSCVVREADLPAVRQVGDLGRKLGKWEKHVVAAIDVLAKDQTAGIEKKAVITLAAEREPKPGGRDVRTQHARRALKTLLEADGSPYFDDGDSLSIG